MVCVSLSMLIKAGFSPTECFLHLALWVKYKWSDSISTLLKYCFKMSSTSFNLSLKHQLWRHNKIAYISWNIITQVLPKNGFTTRSSFKFLKKNIIITNIIQLMIQIFWCLVSNMCKRLKLHLFSAAVWFQEGEVRTCLNSERFEPC